MSRLALDSLSGSSGALTRPTGSNQMSIQIIRLAIWLALDNINFFIQTIRFFYQTSHWVPVTSPDEPASALVRTGLHRIIIQMHRWEPTSLSSSTG